ncbi:cation:proton antiporter [Sphingomonas sp. DT-51]|uniref:cation:proton antiporter domain-containing protein n=1 Tax=Sphingomonas sp. DT-51 TaxID=3396165 RepID=UPI003F1C0D93
MQHLLDVLLPIILLLGLGLAAAIGARAVGLSPVVGYIALGVLLSACGPDLRASAQTISVLAELGVLFLLFDIGLHFSFRQMRRQASDIFGFGSAQVILNACLVAMVAAVAGLGLAPALLLGATLALSSTAVVARLIAERHQQDCPVGLTATAILIFQDLAGILILIVAEAMGAGSAPIAAIGIALAKAAGCFAGAMVISAVLVRPVLDLVARSRSEEVFTAVALLVALSAGWLTGTLGLSVTLGAFLGGAMIADSPYRSIIQSEARPFRGLLLGFFFVSIGLALDVRVLLGEWPLVIAASVILVLIKIVGNMGASLAFRWSVPGSVQLAFLLAQGSEFGLVILSVPSMRSLLGAEATSVLVAALALSLAVTPNLATAGRRLAGELRARRVRQAAHETEPRALLAPVLVLGMGDVGRAVADGLIHFGLPYAAMDPDERQLRNAVADGYSVEFGDLTDPRVWEPMALAGRRMIVLTDPSLETSARLTPLAQRYYPDVRRIAVVRTKGDAVGFAKAGLEPVLEEGSGDDTAAHVLRMLDFGEGEIDAWLTDRSASRVRSGDLTLQMA